MLYWDVSPNATNATSADAAAGVTSDKLHPAFPTVGATPGNEGFLTLGVAMRASAEGGVLADMGSGYAASFFALGLSAEGQGMKGMDVALLRRQREQWVLEDRWAVDYAMPTLDASQDKVLLSAGLVEGAPEVVAFSFRMPLANCGWVVWCGLGLLGCSREEGMAWCCVALRCRANQLLKNPNRDPTEDAPIRPDTDAFVLWAQGSVDPETGDPQYHGPTDRGATRLPLRTVERDGPWAPKAVRYYLVWGNLGKVGWGR